MKLVLQILSIKLSKNSGQFDISGYSKLDEIPYDFIRKRLSIVVSSSDKTITKTIKIFIITKGALQNILDICSFAEMPDGKCRNIYIQRKNPDRFEDLGNKGSYFRFMLS